MSKSKIVIAVALLVLILAACSPPVPTTRARANNRVFANIDANTSTSGYILAAGAISGSAACRHFSGLPSLCLL